MRSLVLALALASVVPLGCSTSPKTEESRATMSADSSSALSDFRQDSGIAAELDSAAGYAILPVVRKGAAIAGATWGRGEVYEHGKMIGYCRLSEGSIGAQVGGESYSELIIFKDQAALNKFKTGNYTFASNASAVAIKKGVNYPGNYRDGVAVFIHTTGGLMADASIGGQKIRYEAI